MLRFMIPLSTAMLVILALSGTITVFAMMRVFTNIIEHETDLHDLRNRIKQLQFERQLYLARLSGHIPEESDIEILNDIENDPIEAVEQAEAVAAELGEELEAMDAVPQAA
jgi:predicted RNase H-related nuclease YkuK (DUF458 family)